MVCISYKKNTIKWNRVKFKQTCPRSSTTSCSAKNSTSKKVKFKQTCPRSSTTSRSAFPFAVNAEIMISPFYNLPQNGRNIICVNSSPRSEKVKKILWERFVQKEYHLCNTDEMDEKITNENTSQKFNGKTTRSSSTIVNEIFMKNF